MPEVSFFDTVLRDLVMADRLFVVPAQLLMVGLPYRQILPFWSKVERSHFAPLSQYQTPSTLWPMLFVESRRRLSREDQDCSIPLKQRCSQFQ